MRAASRVTSQNQTSVPAEVRRRFGIHPGTVLEWQEVDGELRVRAATITLEQARAEIRRMGRTGGRALTLHEMKRAKAEAVLAKHRRAGR
jgi:AbrB family looped-hinge helix DNA binding protein